MPFALKRKWVWIPGIAAAILIIVAALGYLLCSDNMRRYVENQMNSRLQGYRVQVGKACFNPITFSLRLRQLDLIQEAKPDPPVARIAGLDANLRWRDLLRGHIVGELNIEAPKVVINRTNFRIEQQSDVPLKNKGWQDAVQAIYPIKINELRVSDGDLTYIDEGPYRPMHASHLELRASNIRNIKYPNDVFPSSVRITGTIFDKGTLTIEGRANFLETPHMGVKGSVELAGMDLSYFEPLLIRRNFSIRNGTLSTRGDLEYTPRITAVNLSRLDIDDMDANYIHMPQTAAIEKRRVREASNTARQLSNKPTAQVRVSAINIRRSTLAYTDKTAHPAYRLFFADVSGTVHKFSNQLREGTSTLDITGKFMNSGNTRITGTFRPETKKADLRLHIAIENTDMPAMNDLFRSAAHVDIKSGLFSFYSEMRIENGYINGWIKPMFKDIKITDRQDRKDGNILHKAYVGTVKVLARVLENRSKKQVATKTDISGPIENPDASIWQILTHLMGNAWIRAILPGFNSEASY